MGKDRDATGESTGAWWAVPPDEALRLTGTDPERGLSAAQVEESRQRYGSNEVRHAGPTSLWTLLWESVKSPMMVLLLTIAAISLAVGQVREALVMVFVVAMYVAVHLLNKARSDRTMARLREVQAPKTVVLRAGQLQEIPFAEVVRGDIMPLRAGTRVAADARLLSSAGLLLDESTLTGESAPVQKDADADVAVTAPLAERPTAVFAGTVVLDGQGKALVMAVGEHSELGKIAGLSGRPDTEPTPLQKEMNDLAGTLAVVAIVVSLLIPLAGFLRGFELRQMILTWLSLTFLMVPGQPPIIIAMALALASLELARQGVIVRRLQGAETLGSVTTILSDKTGTMTENRMRLGSVLFPDGQLVQVSERDQSEPVREFLRWGLQAIPEDARDPTDLAVINAAREMADVRPADRGRLIDQIGFARGRTFRSLEYRQNSHHRLFVAGAPEFLIDHADRYRSGSEVRAWSSGMQEQVRGRIQELAAQGKRITAYGYQEDASLDGQEPTNLVFLGAAVIDDPIRPGVRGAVAALAEAGIRTVMVTGDVPETAAYVGREVGLSVRRIMTGRELEGRAEREYEEAVRSIQVFARTTPEEKLRLVEAAKRLGETVAVTGDGINDAPALRTAHIGIAMGQRGTDVAREAAGLVLTDDDFARLVDGVAIGRKAYDNFRKGITYYLSAKAILLAIFIVPLLVGVPFPLAPIQIIFTELLMDLASSTIFITEAAEPDTLRRKPRPRTRFLSWRVGKRILRNMAGLTIVILAVYFGSLGLGYRVEAARTAVYATWLLGHIILAMNLKQEQTPLLKQGLLSNRFAAGWLAGMIGLVLAMTLVPAVQSVLQTTPLSGVQWLMVVAGAILASGWIEVVKWLRGRAV